MKTHVSRAVTYPSASRGMTLLEVIITMAILSTCLMALSSSTISTMVATRQTAETAAALRAARQKLEQISGERIEDILRWYIPGGDPGVAFEVIQEYTPSGRHRLLPGIADPTNPAIPVMAGEIVLITRENATQSTYGRDLFPKDGQPDGILFRGLPIDLNGNGNTSDGETRSFVLNKAVRIPVGIVIRWEGAGGRKERYELWTILSDYPRL